MGNPHVPPTVTLKLDERALAAQEYERIVRRCGLVADRLMDSREAREQAFENFGKPGRDVAGLGGVLGQIAERNGWKPRMQVAALGSDWASIVGPGIAQHSSVASLRAGILTIRADSPSWTMTLKGMLPQIQDAIARKLDGLEIEEIRITGPQAHGPGTSRRMYVERQVRDVAARRRNPGRP